MTEERDLFLYPEEIPADVREILHQFERTVGDSPDYQDLQNLEDDLRPLGYTFDWGLDAVPYDLRPIEG
jgi:hypothetical protein